MPTQKIDLNKIAKLAYLKIDDKEKELLESKLEKVISYVGKIQNLELETAINKTAKKQQIFHQDKTQKSAINVENLGSFVENNCFIVPKVVKDN